MKNRLKGLIIIVMSFLIMVMTVSASGGNALKIFDASNETASIFVEGQEMSMSNYIYGGKTWVGLRDLAESLGFHVSWDGVNEKIEIFKLSEPTPTPQRDNEEAPYVFMEDLIQNPDRYDGKYVWVKGYWIGGDMEGKLYWDRDSLEKRKTENALELDFAVSIVIESLPPVTDMEYQKPLAEQVIFKGKFSRTPEDAAFGGRLEKIENIDIF